MNLKVIINSLLIIIVLHLFLQNLNYEMNIGIENVVKKNNNIENFESDNSRDSLLKFLDSDGVDSNNPNPSNSNLENNRNTSLSLLLSEKAPDSKVLEKAKKEIIENIKCD